VEYVESMEDRDIHEWIKPFDFFVVEEVVVDAVVAGEAAEEVKVGDE